MRPVSRETEIAYNNNIMIYELGSFRVQMSVPLGNKRCEIILTTRRSEKNTDYVHRDYKQQEKIKMLQIINIYEYK